MTRTRPLPATLVILAGGESIRMAVPKAHILVGGKSIIEREISALAPIFEETLIVANDPLPFIRFGRRVVPDMERFRGLKGPMTGAYSGLMEAGRDFCFLVGCDMPFIKPGLVFFMAGLFPGHDAVIPKAGGFAEPLLGFYGKAAAPAMERALERGSRRLQEIFGGLDVRYVEEDEMRAFDPELVSLTNVNTPEDLARAADAEVS